MAGLPSRRLPPTVTVSHVTLSYLYALCRPPQEPGGAAGSGAASTQKKRRKVPSCVHACVHGACNCHVFVFTSPLSCALRPQRRLRLLPPTLLLPTLLPLSLLLLNLLLQTLLPPSLWNRCVRNVFATPLNFAPLSHLLGIQTCCFTQQAAVRSGATAAPSPSPPLEQVCAQCIRNAPQISPPFPLAWDSHLLLHSTGGCALAVYVQSSSHLHGSAPRPSPTSGA